MDCHLIWNAFRLVRISFILWIFGWNSTKVILLSSVYISPRVAYWCKVSCWKVWFFRPTLEKFFPSLWALGGFANRRFFLSRYTWIHIQSLRFWTDSCAFRRCIFTPIVLSSSVCWHFIVKKSSSLRVIDSWFIQKDIVYYCHHFFSSLVIHIQPAGSSLTSLRWLNVFMCHRALILAVASWNKMVS